MKKLLLAVLIGCMLAMPSWAANTVTINKKLGIINIVPDGSTDFDLVATYPDLPDGVRLREISYLPSAGTDVLRFKSATDAGVDIMPPLKSITGATQRYIFDDSVMYKPYLDASACTFGTAASVIIIIKYVPGLTGF